MNHLVDTLVPCPVCDTAGCLACDGGGWLLPVEALEIVRGIRASAAQSSA